MSYHYQNTDRYHNIVTLNLPLMRKDLTGRTVIVTGANVGLGLEGARHFHAMNPARLILAVRDVSKGETAKQSILDTATKVKKTGETKLEVWQLDLNSFESVNKFAKRCEEELDRLDILLCSAAVAAGEFILTEGGYESTVQTNVLCTFQHIALLLPLMNKTVHLPAPVEGVKLKPHIAIATSGTHATAAFPERDAPKIYKVLNDPSSFEIFERYAASKLMNFLLTRKLSTSPAIKDGPDGKEVVVCAVDPGFVRTRLSRHVPAEPLKEMLAQPALMPEEGARNYVWACLEDDIPPGTFVDKCALGTHSEWVDTEHGKQVQSKLWKETADIVTRVSPGTENFWKN